MPKTIKGRVGWEVVKRLIKAIPVIGPVLSVGLAGQEIRNKGLVPGVVHVGLDVTPWVGTAKNVIEIVTGDWIPDKAPKTPALPETSQVSMQPLQEPGQVDGGGKATFPT